MKTDGSMKIGEIVLPNSRLDAFTKRITDENIMVQSVSYPGTTT